MKSKAEILNSYYSTSNNGLPEIAAESLLKAMDEYAEQAFNAARLNNENGYTYPAFNNFTTASEATIKPENTQADNIRLMADSILPHFLPDDATAGALSFNLKTNGLSYTAYYAKDDHGYWQFSHYTG